MNQKTQQAVDQLLMEQGYYTPLELLLAEGRLLYCDYESWRGGELSELESTLFGDPKQCKQLLSEAAGYADKLNLIAERLHYSVWGNSGNSTLCFSANSAFNGLFHTRYRKSADIPQLDLFMDSTGTVLVNGTTQALIERNYPEARRLLNQLFDSDPGNNRLGGLEQLVEAAEALTLPVNAPAELLNRLQQELSPLAADLLESGSRHFLTPQWHRLTLALRGRAFDAETPQLHSSYSAMQAMDWQQVKTNVASEQAWQQQPLLIRRHAQACGRLHQETEAVSDWFLLCWHFPDQAEPIRLEAEPPWRRRWQNFIELEPELPNQDFPAWVMVNEPGLSKQLANMDGLPTKPPEAWLLTLALMDGQLLTVDSDFMANRKALKACNPALFHHYLQRLGG
ncbi:MAG: hypothetical protein L3J28_02965 [Candidatus Polarisedimenticolaceae bacterium]|nr:hypothetical protein [Candidatus Polarisedimenticolaceae bacterium]